MSPVPTAVGTETLEVPDAAVPQLIVVVLIVAAFALLKKLLSLKEEKMGVVTINKVTRKRFMNLFDLVLTN